MATFIPNVTDSFPEPALYRPDFGFMDKMLSRRQQMYERGFSEVAGKYGELTRELSNPKNVQQRDQFLKESMNNLKNLSSMDLSQQQNVEAASSVFAPFWKNTHVLGDMMLTKFYNQQENIAESFRLKDGGKEYSDNNINIVRMQRQAFAKDDPMNYAQYYQNKEYFKPYVDVKNFFSEKMKDFKPDDISSMRMKGLYFYKEEDASVRPEAVKRYLQGVMTDKVKEQIRINAVVKYGNNPQALISDYANTASSSVKQLNGELDKVNSYLKVEKDPTIKEQLTAYKTDLENSKNVYSNHLDRIKSGDTSFMAGKTNELAYDITYNEEVNSFANAQARKVYKMEITANSAAVAVWKDAQDDRRANARMAFDFKMKQLEAAGKFDPVLATGSFKGGTLDNNVETVVKNYQDATVKKQQAVANITKFILDYYNTDGTKDKNDLLKETDLIKNPEILESFLSEHKNLEAVQNFQKSISSASIAEQSYQSLYNSAKEKAAEKLTPQQKSAIQASKAQVSQLGPIVVVENGRFKNFQSQDIFDGLLAGTVNIKYTGGVTQLNIQGKTYTLNPKGNDVFVRQAIEKVKNIEALVGRVPGAAEASKSYNTYVTDYFKNSSQENLNFVTYGDDSKRSKAQIAGIEALLGTAMTEGTIKVSNINEVPTKGRVYFTFNSNPNSQITVDGKLVKPTAENVLKVLQGQVGPGQTVGQDVKGFYIENPNAPGSLLAGLTDNERVLFETDKYTGDGYRSPFYFPYGESVMNGRVLPQFSFQKNVGADGSVSYYLFHEDGGGIIGGKSYSSLLDLMTMAKSFTQRPDLLQIQKTK